MAFGGEHIGPGKFGGEPAGKGGLPAVPSRVNSPDLPRSSVTSPDPWPGHPPKGDRRRSPRTLPSSPSGDPTRTLERPAETTRHMKDGMSLYEASGGHPNIQVLPGDWRKTTEAVSRMTLPGLTGKGRPTDTRIINLTPFPQYTQRVVGEAHRRGVPYAQSEKVSPTRELLALGDRQAAEALVDALHHSSKSEINQKPEQRDALVSDVASIWGAVGTSSLPHLEEALVRLVDTSVVPTPYGGITYVDGGYDESSQETDQQVKKGAPSPDPLGNRPEEQRGKPMKPDEIDNFMKAFQSYTAIKSGIKPASSDPEGIQPEPVMIVDEKYEPPKSLLTDDQKTRVDHLWEPKMREQRRQELMVLRSQVKLILDSDTGESRQRVDPMQPDYPRAPRLVVDAAGTDGSKIGTQSALLADTIRLDLAKRAKAKREKPDNQPDEQYVVIGAEIIEEQNMLAMRRYCEVLGIQLVEVYTQVKSESNPNITINPHALKINLQMPAAEAMVIAPMFHLAETSQRNGDKEGAATTLLDTLSQPLGVDQYMAISPSGRIYVGRIQPPSGAVDHENPWERNRQRIEYEQEVHKAPQRRVRLRLPLTDRLRRKRPQHENPYPQDDKTIYDAEIVYDGIEEDPGEPAGVIEAEIKDTRELE